MVPSHSPGNSHPFPPALPRGAGRLLTRHRTRAATGSNSAAAPKGSVGGSPRPSRSRSGGAGRGSAERQRRPSAAASGQARRGEVRRRAAATAAAASRGDAGPARDTTPRPPVPGALRNAAPLPAPPEPVRRSPPLGRPPWRRGASARLGGAPHRGPPPAGGSAALAEACPGAAAGDPRGAGTALRALTLLELPARWETASLAARGALPGAVQLRLLAKPLAQTGKLSAPFPASGSLPACPVSAAAVPPGCMRGSKPTVRRTENASTPTTGRNLCRFYHFSPGWQRLFLASPSPEPRHLLPNRSTVSPGLPDCLVQRGDLKGVISTGILPSKIPARSLSFSARLCLSHSALLLRIIPLTSASPSGSTEVRRCRS